MKQSSRLLMYLTHKMEIKLENGYELKETAGKGKGIFAIKCFKAGDIVMTGRIKEKLYKNHSHASQIGENEYVLHAGSITKVNHSCNPDCGIRLNETGAHDFVAMRDISVNEEITFDYAMRNYGVDYFPELCMCGSEKCRGKISGWKDLSNKKKKEYEGFAAPYLLALDIKHTYENALTNQILSTGSRQGANPTLVPLTLSERNS
jgi:hypothetical protein